MGNSSSRFEEQTLSNSNKMARRGSNVDKLEDWLDQTEEKLYKAAVETGRRRSSLIKVSEFSNFMKGIQEEYHAQGFEEKAAQKEMDDIKCRKPLPGSKSGTLKEKNDLIMNLVNTVEKKTGDLEEAWGHYGSANPAYSVIPSYRNEDKSLPENAYEKDPTRPMPTARTVSLPAWMLSKHSSTDWSKAQRLPLKSCWNKLKLILLLF